MGGSWRYIALNIGTFFIRLWSQIHVVLKKWDPVLWFFGDRQAVPLSFAFKHILLLIAGLRRLIQSGKASVPCADCGGLQVLPNRPERG